MANFFKNCGKNFQQFCQPTHCHGCGLSGDAFSFVMRIEGLTFPEAKARLAAELGLVLGSEPHRDWARVARDRELAGYWRDGLIEVARDLRNSFFRSYHRARRHLRDCRSTSGGCCALALEVGDFYEQRYTLMDEKIDVLVQADISIIVEQWKARHGRVA